MAAAVNPSLLVPVGIGALVLWRMYWRFRRMVGRQHLSSVRPWVTVCFFPILTVLLATASIGQPVSQWALAGGVVIGVGLGIYGLRMTRFEKTPEGLFYTPNAHLGIALSLLLVGRVIYRYIQLYATATPVSGPPQINYATSPLTMLIFGTLAAYYVTYAVGLLRWERSGPP